MDVENVDWIPTIKLGYSEDTEICLVNEIMVNVHSYKLYFLFKTNYLRFQDKIESTQHDNNCERMTIEDEIIIIEAEGEKRLDYKDTQTEDIQLEMVGIFYLFS